MTPKQEILLINKQTEYIKQQQGHMANKLLRNIEQVSYDCKDKITFKSNLGNFEMNYADGLELAWGIMDALCILTTELENLLEQADKKFDLGKF